MENLIYEFHFIIIFILILVNMSKCFDLHPYIIVYNNHIAQVKEESLTYKGSILLPTGDINCDLLIIHIYYVIPNVNVNLVSY